MNMATASRINLFPDNFAREVSLHFNLPSLHSLIKKFIPEIVLEEVKKKNKEYIRRGKGILWQIKKFKYAELSSSTGTFRSKEHEKFNGVHWHCDIYRLHWLFWIHIKNWYIFILFVFTLSIFISKKDKDCRIFELQLLNLAPFHFETYWKSFEHVLSIDKKHFVCMYEYFK